MSESLRPHGPPAACQASLSFTIFRSLLKLMSSELVMPSNHLILCHPLLLLPSVFPGIRLFSSESALHIRWPKHWSFSFSISFSNEYSELFPLGLTGLISLGLSRVFSSINLKASILRRSTVFMVQLSRPYMTYWKNRSFDYSHFCQQSDVSAF